MQKLTGFFLLIACYTGFAQKAAPAPAVTRYIMLTGTIDKYPVTFHLYRINDEFSGHYYYNNTEMPMGFAGKMDKARFLKLIHSGQTDKDEEKFDGVFKDSVYSGTWTYKGKVTAFRVVQKKESNNLKFDYIWASGDKKVPKKADEYGPEELSFEAVTIWPAAGFPRPLADTLKQFIRASFDEKNSTEEIGKILLRRKNELLNQAAKSRDEIETYSSSDAIQVEYINNRLLSLSHSNYSFSGGAHGNYWTNYTCFNLLNNRRLTITDVLDTLAAKPVLESLLEKNFRASYADRISKDDKLEEVLFVDKIPVNDNFLLTGKGITFNYNPYEIAAYAFGDASIYIPYKEIEQYLKPEFKKLLAQ